jgi:transketolase N-terminal domain/subunit
VAGARPHDSEQGAWLHRALCHAGRQGLHPIETVDTFCRRDSILGGHPEAAEVPGVEASTGSLGHGWSYAVGMALAARIEKRDSRVIVVMGEGEIDEGSACQEGMRSESSEPVAGRLGAPAQRGHRV